MLDGFFFFFLIIKHLKLGWNKKKEEKKEEEKTFLLKKRYLIIKYKPLDDGGGGARDSAEELDRSLLPHGMRSQTQQEVWGFRNLSRELFPDVLQCSHLWQKEE